MFPEWGRELYANRDPDFPVFYYHKSVERIVLSHALFWVMTQNFRNKVAKGEVLPSPEAVSGGDV